MKIIIFLFVITLILYSIIVLENYYPKQKFIKKNQSNIEKNICNINLMTPEKCYNNSIDICPMSSYKQCTNNNPLIYYPPLSKCVCNSFSLELCTKPQSDLCSIKKCNPSSISQKYQIYSKCNPRVNIYNTKFI